ncbi:AraC family transcriptional regulator, L-rhamnose operon regulatory protein RhaS [Lachnospiraceae bacterium G41]|nr:AraC family transcriptional regulator, L-rhamnose operon regulatory protein RhaS [Lachnospiraceae bacterium G41]
MNLFTKSYNPDWGRIVDMTVGKNSSLSENIKDETVFKYILHEKGKIELGNNGKSYMIKEPSLILLSDKDCPDFKALSKASDTVLYFKPSVLRDEFTLSALHGEKYETAFGTAVYQDYYLIRYFIKTEEFNERIIPLSAWELGRIKGLLDSINTELTTQYDGFWPCRSRSFLMELLFFTQFLCQTFEGNNKVLYEDDTNFSLITEYLNEHYNDEISLESITKKFNINRNKLNNIFLNKTSKTCLNYLMNLRIDMAKIILANTELPVSEVAGRVGYSDSNYFTKIFKKMTGSTPSAFRNSNSTCR